MSALSRSFILSKVLMWRSAASGSFFTRVTMLPKAAYWCFMNSSGLSKVSLTSSIRIFCRYCRFLAEMLPILQCSAWKSFSRAWAPSSWRPLRKNAADEDDGGGKGRDLLYTD